MSVRHTITAPTSTSTKAAMVAPQVSDEAVVSALNSANVPVSNLLVRSAGGIVILRGNAAPADAEKAVAVVRGLGVTRVANLITPFTPIDDESIRREGERQLARATSLTGCVLRVSCENGVLRVTGTVRHELQKDAAAAALRAVRGAQGVRVDLQRL
jgi:osmotically-inducible protein OsmY